MSHSHKTASLVCTALCVVLGLSVTASPLLAKNKNGVGQGSEPVYYYASSSGYSDLGFSEVKSNGTDSKQLVFRDTPIDIDVLTTKCNYDTLDGDNDGVISGVLVLQPKSNKEPYVATLTFWFDAALNSGDVVTHRLYMTGTFGDLDEWPPADTNFLEFEIWEVAAENPRAQTSDCDDGGSLDPEDVIISVSHE